MISMTIATDQEYGNWQKYANPNPLQRFLVSRFLRAVECLVEQSGASTLADIGCAEGFAIRHLQTSRPALDCVGIDIDTDALERGRLVNPGIPLYPASIYSIPYKSGAFDLVLCLEVLEHLDQPERALEELMRITRRHCLLSVPHEPFFRLANLLRGKSIARLGDDIDHVNHWGRASFTRFLQASGLIVSSVKMSFPWLIALAEIK